MPLSTWSLRARRASPARLVLAALTLLLSLLTVVASGPRVAWADALPRRQGWVNDPSGAIPQAEREALERELADYEKRSRNEVAVLVVATLGGRTIEDLSFDVAKAWGVGKAGLDNGVLVVVAMRERRSRIETGKGVGHLLPDLACNDILREVMGPRLREGRTGAAVTEGARAVMRRLGTVPPPPRKPGIPGRTWGLILGGLAALVWLYVWIQRVRALRALLRTLDPGGPSRRVLGAFAVTADAVETLLGGYPQEHAQVLAARDRVRKLRLGLSLGEESLARARRVAALLTPGRTIAALRQELVGWHRFAPDVQDHTLRLMEDVELKLWSVVPAVPRAAEARAALDRLVAGTEPARRALLALPASKGFPVAPTPAELLREGREADAAWMCVVATLVDQGPLAALDKVAKVRLKAVEANAWLLQRDGTTLDRPAMIEGDACLRLWAFLRATRAYERVVAEQERIQSAIASASTSYSSDGSASTSTGYDYGSSSSGSSYDGGSSYGGSSGGGDFGGGGSSDSW